MGNISVKVKCTVEAHNERTGEMLYSGCFSARKSIGILEPQNIDDGFKIDFVNNFIEIAKMEEA